MHRPAQALWINAPDHVTESARLVQAYRDDPVRWVEEDEVCYWIEWRDRGAAEGETHEEVAERLRRNMEAYLEAAEPWLRRARELAAYLRMVGDVPHSMARQWQYAIQDYRRDIKRWREFTENPDFNASLWFERRLADAIERAKRHRVDLGEATWQTVGLTKERIPRGREFVESSGMPNWMKLRRALMEHWQETASIQH